MTAIADAAIRLKDICSRHGEHPATRGATDAEVTLIEETFAALEFPLPSALLDVYYVTLGIPGVLNDEAVLGAPCIFNDPSSAFVSSLKNQEDDAYQESVLWLGRGNKADLILDRDGQCALAPEFLQDGTIRLVEPTDFEIAFLAYVDRHVAEIQAEFERA
jgi:hypothetical protein